MQYIPVVVPSPCVDPDCNGMDAGGQSGGPFPAVDSRKEKKAMLSFLVEIHNTQHHLYINISTITSITTLYLFYF